MRAAEDFLSPKMLLCTTIRIPRCVNANVCLIDTRGGLFWVHLILYYLVPSHVITSVLSTHPPATSGKNLQDRNTRMSVTHSSVSSICNKAFLE